MQDIKDEKDIFIDEESPFDEVDLAEQQYWNHIDQQIDSAKEERLGVHEAL